MNKGYIVAIVCGFLTVGSVDSMLMAQENNVNPDDYMAPAIASEEEGLTGEAVDDYVEEGIDEEYTDEEVDGFAIINDDDYNTLQETYNSLIETRKKVIELKDKKTIQSNEELDDVLKQSEDIISEVASLKREEITNDKSNEVMEAMVTLLDAFATYTEGTTEAVE